ncbi:virulence factor TspB C-terminal domain-related protein [Chromobacterium vaccinii]|uniref:TspB protein n=1 Tax=Chromobacterium vaccinii TaxID=1108595 RepID=A0A1D9LCT6_9NEIS|nr:virulence factor TspB C-terminal domain-related protein [Chromobacterium vaccinii]AOZ49040.1 hypothetical protein BKX93_02835 [Chromobacterium vaccinii]
MTTPPILFLAVLLGLLVPPAQAGGYQVGTYYRYGDQITRKATTAADKERLSGTIMKVYLDDRKSLGVTTQIAYGMESNMIQGRMFDHYKIPAKSLSERIGPALRKNMRGGLGGMIGGAAASIAIDYAIEKGWEWMGDAQEWTRPTNAGSTGTGSGRDPYQGYNPDYPVACWDYPKAKSLSTCLDRFYDDHKNSCNRQYYFPSYETKPDAVVVSICGGVVADLHFKQTDPSIPLRTPVPRSKVNDADVDAMADDVILKLYKPLIEAVAKDGTILEMDDAGESSVSGDPVTGPKTVTGSSTETRPDGSTVTTQTQTQTTYKPTGGGLMGKPIGFEQTTTSTTTVNSCTGAGSCSTSTSTSTTNKPAPEPSAPEKTDCEKFPDSIGCSKWGDPPTVPIPEEKREVSFSPKSFSMPATCPPNYEFTLSNGQHFSYSFEWFCKYASAIRTLIILAALISAYFIIFSARKGEGS